MYDEPSVSGPTASGITGGGVAVALTLGEKVDRRDEAGDTVGDNNVETVLLGTRLVLADTDKLRDVLAERVGSCVPTMDSQGDGLLSCDTIAVELRTAEAVAVEPIEREGDAEELKLGVENCVSVRDTDELTDGDAAGVYE